MNRIVLIAGLLSAVGLIGHVSIGRKKFLAPMLEASFNPLAKKIMECQYHYITATTAISTLMILLIGLGLWRGFTAVLYFIAFNYLACAGVQIWIALNSGISWGFFKLNSWIGLVIVAALLFVSG